MPSSAREGRLAANNPQDRRAAKEREDASLLMSSKLLFYRFSRTKKNGGFFPFQTRCPARKRMITQNAIPQRNGPCDSSYKREAQLRSSTRAGCPTDEQGALRF
jgi:hypothetical protein